MTSLLPYRPKPLPDETLTSWISRTAKGNGLRLDRFCRLLFDAPQPWCRLMDQRTELRYARHMSEATGTIWLTAYRTTVAWLLQLQAAETRPYVRLPFLLRASTGSRETHYLVEQVCPACVAVPERAYGRLSFRLAFVTSCQQHRLLLIDSCPSCGAPLAIGKVQDGCYCGRCGISLAKGARAFSNPTVLAFEQGMQPNIAPIQLMPGMKTGLAETGNSDLSPSRRVRRFGFEQSPVAERHKLIGQIAGMSSIIPIGCRIRP